MSEKQLSKEQILEQAKKWVNYNKKYKDKFLERKDISTCTEFTIEEFLDIIKDYKNRENIIIKLIVHTDREIYSDSVDFEIVERTYETDEERQKRIEKEIKRNIKNIKEVNKQNKPYKERLEEEKKKREANEKRQYARLKKKYGE